MLLHNNTHCNQATNVVAYRSMFALHLSLTPSDPHPSRSLDALEDSMHWRTHYQGF